MSDTSFKIEEGTFPLLFLYTDKSEFRGDGKAALRLLVRAV